MVAMKCFGRVFYRPCVQNAHHGLNLGLNFNNKGKMAKKLSKYSDDALIRELNGRGYKCYDEEDGVPLDDVDEDTLIDEVEDYGYFVYDEEVDPEKVWYDVDEWYKRDHFILAKDFDGRQLVDFMLDIFGLGHYVTNDQLIGRLKDFINK